MATQAPNTIIKYDEQNAGFYLFVRDQFNVYQRVEAFNPSHHGQSPNYYVLDSKIPSGLTITGTGTGNTYLIKSTLGYDVAISDTGSPTVINYSNKTVTLNNTADSSTPTNTVFAFDSDRIAFTIHQDADASNAAFVVGTVLASGGNGDATIYALSSPPSGFAIDAARGTITYTGTNGSTTLTAGTPITLTVTAKNSASATPVSQSVTVTVTADHVPFLDNPQLVVDRGFDGTVTLTTEHLNYKDADTNAVNTAIIYTLEGLAAGVSVTKDGTALLENGTFTQQDVIAGKIVLDIDETKSLAGFALSVSNTENQSSAIHDFAILTRFDLTIADTDANNAVNFSNLPDLPYTIDAGRGDDRINLNTEGTSGKDEIIYEYDAQNKIATDGGDVITGFKRGEDIFTLKTKSFAETETEVLQQVGGTDKDSFADDQFIITPDLKFTGGVASVTGITLVFRENQTSSSGRMSDNSVQISFVEALTWDGFLEAIKIGDDANFDYNHLAVKNAVVLPALLGEGSSGFEIEYLTGIVVTDTNAVITENLEADTIVATFATANVSYGGTVVYSVNDTNRFSINTVNGVNNLVFKAGTYDVDGAAPASYEVTITAAGDGLPLNQTFTVNITDINDTPPTLILEPALVNNVIDIAENETSILTVVATPDVVGDKVTYSLNTAAEEYFSIDSDGILTANSSFDYENDPKIYSVTITATTGTGATAQSTDQSVTINITNVFEVTSGNSGTLTNNLLLPTTEVVYTAAADRAVTWGALSGADAGLFTIDSDGQVRFNAATTPTIASKSSYSFTVTATDNADSTAMITQDVTLTVSGIFHIKASSLTYSESVNVAPSAEVDTTSDSFRDPRPGATGNTDDKTIALPALTDGEFGIVGGVTSYSYLARSAQGDTITFDFGDDTYQGGRFVLYNRIGHASGNINGSKVQFMLGEVPVGDPLTLNTSNTDYDGLAYTIEVALSDSSLEFDKVVLTFNNSKSNQNFSEIEIYATKIIDDFSFDENITGDDSAVDKANYYFDNYNAANSLTEGSFTIEGGDGKFDVIYNNTLNKFQLVAVAGANFNYETKSSYELTITANDGSNNSNAIKVTANINNLDDPAVFGSGGRTGAITVGDNTSPSGTLTITDEDSEDSGYKTDILTPLSPLGTYGSIKFTAGTNSWVYTLDETDADTIALFAGEEKNDTFIVTAGGVQANIVIAVTGINDAPISSDGEIVIGSLENYTFSTADFAFSDPDTGDFVEKIIIKSLPSNGTLTLNGAAVTFGQGIAVADLGNLVFTANSNIDFSGTNVTASFTYSAHDGDIESGAYTQTLFLKKAPEFTTITPTNNYSATIVLNVVTNLSEPVTLSSEDFNYRSTNDGAARIAYGFREGKISAYSEFSITLNSSPNLEGSTVQFYYDDVALGDAITITAAMLTESTVTIDLPDGYDTAETILLTHSSGNYEDFRVANIKGIPSVALAENHAGNGDDWPDPLDTIVTNNGITTRTPKTGPVSLGTISRTDGTNVKDLDTITYSIKSATSKRRDGGTDDLTSDFDINATTGEISYIGAGIDQDIYSQAVKLVVAMNGDDIDDPVEQDVYVTILDEGEPISDWTAEIYDGIPVSPDHVLLYLDLEPSGFFFPSSIFPDLAIATDIDESSTHRVTSIEDNELFKNPVSVSQDHTNDTPEYPVLTFKADTTPDITAKNQYLAKIFFLRDDVAYPEVTSYFQGTVTINVVKTFYDTPTETQVNASSNIADTLTGDSTARLIQGRNGNDAITAGSSGDLIIGGYGKDTITLGAGDDLVAYRFASAASGSEWTMTDGGDTINDFDYGKDKLLLIDTRATGAIANYTDFFAAANDAGAGTDPVVGFSVLTAANTANGITTYKITKATITMANAGTSDGTNTGSAAGNALTINFKTGTGYELSASEISNFTQDANNTNLYDLNTDQYTFVQTILGDYGSIDIISDADFVTEFGVTIL